MTAKQFVWVLEYRLSDWDAYHWQFLAVSVSEEAAKKDVQRWNSGKANKWFTTGSGMYQMCRNKWSDGRTESIRLHRAGLIQDDGTVVAQVLGAAQS